MKLFYGIVTYREKLTPYLIIMIPYGVINESDLYFTKFYTFYSTETDNFGCVNDQQKNYNEFLLCVGIISN